MFKHVTAIAVVGCICAATVASASAFTPPHNPVGGGIRTLVPKPIGAGPDPRSNYSQRVSTQPTRTGRGIAIAVRSLR
jgi:hypothetical protein